MKIKEYWLFLEPYVHIFDAPLNILFYNTVNGEYINVHKNEQEVFNIALKLKKPENLYVISISCDDLDNKGILNFINHLKELFFGDLLEKKWSSGKPVQMIPILNIKKDIKNNALNPDIKDLDNLRELSININTFEKNQKKKFQFLFCENEFIYNNEIEFKFIKYLLEYTYPGKIHIHGRNIFKYSKIQELIRLIEELNIYTEFYINYQNPDISLINVANFKNSNSRLNISVSTPVNKKAIQELIEIAKSYEIAYSFDFKIEVEKDIQECEQIISDFNIDEYQFLPYYNDNNIKLFEEAVYQNKNDILEAKPNQNDLLARQAINQLDFGKLHISANADVYANLNHPKLGNLHTNSIHELIYKELYSGKSWRKLRKNVNPCKNCIYNLLCPPLSDYEYVIGKNNLCNVWKD